LLAFFNLGEHVFDPAPPLFLIPFSCDSFRLLRREVERIMKDLPYVVWMIFDSKFSRVNFLPRWIVEFVVRSAIITKTPKDAPTYQIVKSTAARPKE
jgi:hypothetical protein